MKNLIFTLFVFLIFSSSHAVAQQPDSSQILQLLEQRDREVKELLGPSGTDYTDQQRDELKNIINGIIDYNAMSKYALQESFDTLSADEQQRFVGLFSSIVSDQSLSRLDIYRAEVTYNSIDVSGDSAVVNTLAILDNTRIPVTYSMRFRENSQEWVITDMAIDEVSTADNYRRQFQRIIRQRGYAYLLNLLEERAAG